MSIKMETVKITHRDKLRTMRCKMRVNDFDIRALFSLPTVPDLRALVVSRQTHPASAQIYTARIPAR